MIPRIGITGSYDRDLGRSFLSRYYTEAVEAAGGLPLILPSIISEKLCTDILNNIDGLLLSGGVDVDPLIFGEEPLPALGNICPQRDRFELELAKQALARDIPIFGICRGIQLLNIAAGGTVIQDIGTSVKNPVKHDQLAPRWYGTHTIEILSDCKLSIIMGQRIVVNSFHHQSIDKIAPGFKAVAWTTDGVIEAIESEKHNFVVGLQCHPECMWEKDQRILGVFKEFVRASMVQK